MSSSKVNRSFQRLVTELSSKATENEKLSSSFLTLELADALRMEFGSSNESVREIAGLTASNERAVRNWLMGQNCPSAGSLVMLCRHSDRVFEIFLLLAGRSEVIANKKVKDCQEQLKLTLQALEAFDSHEASL